MPLTLASEFKYPFILTQQFISGSLAVCHAPGTDQRGTLDAITLSTWHQSILKKYAKTARSLVVNQLTESLSSFYANTIYIFIHIDISSQMFSRNTDESLHYHLCIEPKEMKYTCHSFIHVK